MHSWSLEGIRIAVCSHQELQPLLTCTYGCVSCNLIKWTSARTLPSSLSLSRSLLVMRIYYLLLLLPLLFLMPVPGNGGIINTLQRYYCRIRSGRCALLSCLPKEEQIGRCSSTGRKCCRRKK
uniref:Beta-defensin 103 n=1 Tax=Canis lupus familiaris TaxID=9615 RepID=A0A8C0MVH8_CANLF